MAVQATIRIAEETIIQMPYISIDKVWLILLLEAAEYLLQNITVVYRSNRCRSTTTANNNTPVVSNGNSRLHSPH